MAPILASTIFFGISSVSFFPTSLSYSAELTFPLQPALVNACMNFLGQMSSFALMATSSLVTDFNADDNRIDAAASLAERQNSSFTVCWVFVSCTAVAVFLAYFVREELRRVNFKQADPTTELATKDHYVINN